MIQTATNESSNTTEEGSNSSAVESQPIHGRGSLVQQVARRVDAYSRHSGVSDASCGHHTPYHPAYGSKPYIRVTVVHILSSLADNHVLELEFVQEDIPPATIDPRSHNTPTNLWAQKIFTEEKLSTPLDSGLDIDIEKDYQALTEQLNAINRKMFYVSLYRLSTFLVYANNIHNVDAVIFVNAELYECCD